MEIKERPILFSGEMVRAILDGRKTQTRRVIKPQPTLEQGYDAEVDYGFDWKGNEDGMSIKQLARLCPFGKPGDRLWVREKFQPYIHNEEHEFDHCYKSGRNWAVSYPATDGVDEFWDEDQNKVTSACKPSIHMPRWASRITLEITDVRVERLQSISHEDAYREGVASWASEALALAEDPCDDVHRFQYLWEAINGLGSWNQNPWVWVIEFKRIT